MRAQLPLPIKKSVDRLSVEQRINVYFCHYYNLILTDERSLINLERLFFYFQNYYRFQRSFFVKCAR